MPSVSGLPPNTEEHKNRAGLIVGIVVTVAILGLIIVFSIVFYKRRKYQEDEEGKKTIMVLYL